MTKALDLPLDIGDFHALRRRIAESWSFDKIEPMSTDEIFARLNHLGILVAPEDFRQAVDSARADAHDIGLVDVVRHLFRGAE